MKTSRIILIIGLAHFALWWLCQTVIYLKHFTPYTNVAYYSPPVGHAAFVMQTVLTFPLPMVAMYPEGHHLQTYLFVVFDSCIWALCVGTLLFGARQITHKRAA